MSFKTKDAVVSL